jgi:parallel beta-helix repeat protein
MRPLLLLPLAVAAFGIACSAVQTSPAAWSPPAVGLARRVESTSPAIDAQYVAVPSLAMAPLAKRVVVSVRRYGATGDGTTDDTMAIQHAFDRVPSGDILYFPIGTYRYSNVLTLRRSDVVLQGATGAALIAASPKNESLVIAGNKCALVDMTVFGTGSKRLTTPESTDVEVTGRYVQIVANRLAGGSSAGIFMFGARDYRITGNSVSDTLADGIHSTNGSRRGLIEGNTVVRSGDDTIAVVSYTGETASGNILINDNRVSGNRWGRGITCVGCTDVVIANNAISDVACCAGVLIANEIETIGVSGVLVENNEISRIEKTKPCCGSQTGQGGIDINGVGTYPIEFLSLEHNRVSDTAFDGIRALDTGTGSTAFGPINVNGNTIANAGGVPIEFVADPGMPSPTTCWANTYDAKPYRAAPGTCKAQRMTSSAWPQFNFEMPEGATWAPDGRVIARPWR